MSTNRNTVLVYDRQNLEQEVGLRESGVISGQQAMQLFLTQNQK